MKELNEFFFMESFYGNTEEFDKALKETSKSKSFLQKEYKNLFQKYVYHNYTDFILINAKEEEKIIYNIIMERMINNEIGFKYTSLELYNSFNFIILKYIIDNKRNESLENISELLNDDNWITIHINYFYFAKPWYKNIIDLINSYFFLYIESLKSKYLITFIIIIIIISLNFWLIWKRFEDKYIELIKRSFDLINLIPEEIKCIIVSKLNE